ncbi:hypothetical protein [Xanthomarina gelatinilytica]|uniref:hypothetical protein n=1 Tax=Xanthomarina gelatinilytica TaxID=1137281 RepID=UPI003AA99D2D
MENRFAIAKKTLCCVFLLSVFLFISCKQKTFNTEDELLEYLKVEENGYLQHKAVNGYNFKLLYKPIDLIVNQELKDNVTSLKIHSLRNKYNEFMYLNLSISKNNQELLSSVPKNENEFGALVNQLSFEMGEKIHLYTQTKDTLDMVDFIYPRLYGMSKATNIMFVFPRSKMDKKNEYLNFTISDLGFNTGEIKFKIPIDIINNEPQLTFKN